MRASFDQNPRLGMQVKTCCTQECGHIRLFSDRKPVAKLLRQAIHIPVLNGLLGWFLGLVGDEEMDDVGAVAVPVRAKRWDGWLGGNAWTLALGNFHTRGGQENVLQISSCDGDGFTCTHTARVHAKQTKNNLSRLMQQKLALRRL